MLLTSEEYDIVDEVGVVEVFAIAGPFVVKKGLD